MKKKKLIYLFGFIIMFVVMNLFVLNALQHPELSFDIPLEVLYLLYLAYVVIMIVFLVKFFATKK